MDSNLTSLKFSICEFKDGTVLGIASGVHKDVNFTISIVCRFSDQYWSIFGVGDVARDGNRHLMYLEPQADYVKANYHLRKISENPQQASGAFCIAR